MKEEQVVKEKRDDGLHNFHYKMRQRRRIKLGNNKWGIERN